MSSDLRDATDEVLTGRTLGEFELLERLDEGGCGSVYRARQDGLARAVVVKVLHARAPTADASLPRLVREAQLACRVDHPYAVHVYGFGVEDDGLLWIAMELVDGVSLEEWIEEHGPMSLEAFLPFFERVAEVVQAAHERGVIHRDLKPRNIMVVESGDTLLPKLLDFGVAKLIDDLTGREQSAWPADRVVDDALTPEGFTIGTPSYMAPELWTEPETAGPAADIYALGVIAFESLTGRRPYRADSYRALGVQHCYDPVPAGPEPLRRALAKLPSDRHDSALDLAAALRVEAGREQRDRRARRIGMVAAMTAAALVFGVAEWHAFYQTRLAQQRATAAEHEAAATVLTAEVEQGRAALLTQDYAGAQHHLGEAWRRGDHSRSTEFMLARATQPLRAELAKFPAAKGRMWSASWSPDGSYVVTTDDAGAQIWDATTYQLLSPLPHEDVVYAAVWTPAGRLVTACGDGSVRIWDAARGSLVRELRLHGKTPRWYALAVSGDRVAAVDAKGTIAAVWNAGTGAVLTELPLSGDGWPAVAFSSNGRWLAASGGGAVQVVQQDAGPAAERRARTLTFGEQVRAIAWDPARPNLLVGTAVGTALLWSPRGGAGVSHQLGEAVTAVAFAPDGSRLAIGGEDGTQQIVDGETGRIVEQGNYLHARVASLAFSAGGARVVAAGASGELAVDGEVLAGPKQQLRGATFGPAGRVLAASWDGTARVWDARSPYRQWSAGRLSSGFGLFGGVEPDERYLAIACPGCATRIWDTARDTLLAELPEVPRSERVPYPVVSARGDRAAIARGLDAEVYELPGGKLLRTVRHTAPVTALAFDGADFMSGDDSGAVLVSRDDGTSTPARGGNSSIDAFATLPGGRIAAADARGRVRILPAGPVIDVDVRARMLRPSPDGHRLLIVAYYSERSEPMVLVDLDRGTLLRLDGPAAVTARWVSGNRILSAHADSAARLWNADGALLHTYTGGARFLADAVLTQDGSMVIGGGGDGVLRFWDTSTGKPLWVVSAHKPYIMGLHLEGDDIVTRGIGGEVARWHIPAHDAVFSGKSANPLPF